PIALAAASTSSPTSYARSGTIRASMHRTRAAPPSRTRCIHSYNRTLQPLFPFQTQSHSMMRRLFADMFLFPLLALADALPPPPIAAKAWLLMDYQTGQIIAEHNADERLEPASLTKLMTAYLVAQALEKKQIQPDQVVPVSVNAWKAGGSRMFIEPRKPVTV